SSPRHSTASLHDALPIYLGIRERGELMRLEINRKRSFRSLDFHRRIATGKWRVKRLVSIRNLIAVRKLPDLMERTVIGHQAKRRSEEHTSELQSREKLVC